MAWIRKHETDTGGMCKHCGAMNPDPVDNTCIARLGEVSEAHPEPARRVYAADDFDTISARVAELAAERGEPEGIAI